MKIRILAIGLTTFFLAFSTHAIAQDDFNEAGDDAGAKDPLDDSPLLKNPDSPEELFDAVRLMMDFGQLDVAKRYLEMLLDANPDGATLRKLRDKYGPAKFLGMARTRELRPESAELLKRMNEALREQANDPVRAMTLIKMLEDGKTREPAILTLKESGTGVIPYMVGVLGDSETPELHDPVTYALVRLGKSSVPALIAAIDSPTATVRVGVITALGYIGDKRAVPHLLSPAFLNDEDVTIRKVARKALTKLGVMRGGARSSSLQLRDLALKHYRGDSEWELDGDGNTELWLWDSAAGTVASTQSSAELASLFTASKTAARAMRLSPGDAELQSLFVSTSLAWETARAGWQQPIPGGKGTALDLSVSTGEDISMHALHFALHSHSDHGARGALTALGNFANPDNAGAAIVNDAPLIAALNFPNNRVQFAAADTVLSRGTKPGSAAVNRIVEILARTLSDGGNNSALIIDQNQTRGQTTGSHLASLGLDVHSAQTSRAGFKTASTRNDIAVILVNANCQQWSLTDFVRNARSDSRTSGIPIIVYGPPEARVSTKSLVKKTPLMMFIEESNTPDPVLISTRSFLEKHARIISATEREQQKAQAAWWFAWLARNGHGRYDLTPGQTALFEGTSSLALAGNCLTALETIPNAAAQTQLYDVVSGLDRAEDIRTRAALHLAAHVQKYGMLLNQTQRKGISRLREETPSPDMETALASVLGAARPDAQLIQKRLESFSLPEKP